MRKKLFITVGMLLLVLSSTFAQKKKMGVYVAGFYNVENLWDYLDDPNNPRDNDYTPEGKYQWTQNKYEQKLHNIARVISKMGSDYCPAGPAIIGVAEVENRKVLDDLVKNDLIASRNYQVVHFDSPDHRGIDVAALYNPRLFTFVSAQTFAFKKPDMPNYRTRDILLVSGLLAGEPFHVLVNHWPSRYGGSKSSPMREFAAQIAKHVADSIYQDNPKAKVLIIGDMNDDPNNKSCSEVLDAKRKIKDVKEDGYYNATWKLYDAGIGTLCFQDKWNLFDQHIVSGNLIGKDFSTLKFWKAEVFNWPFLIQQEGKNKGYPMRTFSGTTFINGFSDHLPTLTYYVKELK